MDDNDTNRRIFKLQAEKWGMIAHDTAFPRSALSMIERGEAFDLIVVDMFMPEMDGAALARAIRERKTGVPLPALLARGQRDIGLARGTLRRLSCQAAQALVSFDTPDWPLRQEPLRHPDRPHPVPVRSRTWRRSIPCASCWRKTTR